MTNQSFCSGAAILKKPAISRGLLSFIKKYQPQKDLVVNLELEEEIRLEKTAVSFLPFYKFLFSDID